MESHLKVNQIEHFDLKGVSKKGSSDMVFAGEGQKDDFLLVGTNKYFYKLQKNEQQKFLMNPIKNWEKSEEEDFVLMGSARLSKEEVIIYICTSNDEQNLHHLMLFRNEFRDLIETITIPFKPIRTEPMVAFGRFYLGVAGENQFQFYVLVMKKDKKVDLLQIKDFPEEMKFDDVIVCMDTFIVGFMIYIAFGLMDGTIIVIVNKLEENLSEDRNSLRFFSKEQHLREETNFQLPITSIKFCNKVIKDGIVEKTDLMLTSASGYVVVFENFLKKHFDNPLVVPLKSDHKLETIEDGMTVDLDDDGEDEIIALTYLGGLYVLKVIEGELKVVDSKDLNSVFYNIYYTLHDQKHIVLCGDNEVRVYEVSNNIPSKATSLIQSHTEEQPVEERKSEKNQESKLENEETNQQENPEQVETLNEETQQEQQIKDQDAVLEENQEKEPEVQEQHNEQSEEKLPEEVQGQQNGAE